MKNVKEILKDGASYLKSKKEKRDSKNQMEKDLKRFWKEFDRLDADDQQRMEEVAEFRLEDGSSVNINLDDKKKEGTIREMVDILNFLPRHQFFIVYTLLKEKREKQKELAGVLSSGEDEHGSEESTDAISSEK